MTTILDEAKTKMPDGAHLLLLGEYGSSAHGVSTAVSDQDFIGVAAEPQNVILGLESYEHTLLGKTNPSERTAAGTDEGKIFSLKKFTKLVEGGNTDVMASLFLPDYLEISEAGKFLVENRDAFVSHAAMFRFGMHLTTERRRMNGDAKVKVLRPELIAEFGFDNKAAYQAVKLGFHGLSLARNHVMEIPFGDEQARFIKNIRAGKVSREEIDKFLDDTIEELNATQPSAKLPERPDRDRVNSMLAKIYRMTVL